MVDETGAPFPPCRNIYELFVNRAAALPEDEQFWSKLEGSWTATTLGTLRGRVLRLAARLGSLGVRPGDRVALFAENSLHWVVADQAIMALGAVVVPIYPTSTAEEARFILEDSGARVACASGEARVRALRTLGASAPRTLIALDQPAADGVLSLRDIARDPEPAAGQDAAGLGQGREALATLVYTSGTSGRPKGVMLSHGNILSNTAAALKAFPLSSADTCLSFLPLSHMFERTAGYYVMFAAGARIYYAEGIDRVPQNLVEVKPTVVISVPRLYEKVYARIRAAASEGSALKKAVAGFAFRVAAERAEAWERQGSGSPLRTGPGLWLKSLLADALMFRKVRARMGGQLRWFISGGAPLAPEIARFFFGVGAPIQEGYGLTETSPIIAANRPGEIRFGTVGRPLDGVEVKIAEDGEILCKGPLVMKGYLNLPEETAEALKDGWFHTGDIGEIDSAGALKITDRKKALIVLSNGKKVAPMEVEGVLKRDPLFAQVVPWGDGKPFITALVVPDCGRLASLLARPAPQTEGERERLCRDPEAAAAVAGRAEQLMVGLAPFKRVHKVYLHPREFTQEGGEMTPTLKIKTRVIKEKFGAPLEALYQKATLP